MKFAVPDGRYTREQVFATDADYEIAQLRMCIPAADLRFVAVTVKNGKAEYPELDTDKPSELVVARVKVAAPEMVIPPPPPRQPPVVVVPKVSSGVVNTGKRNEIVRLCLAFGIKPTGTNAELITQLKEAGCEVPQ